MNSLSQEYFETIYDDADDPWSFATSPYEAEKYARSLSVLAPHYRRALELGCSIGVFTEQLAQRCDTLVGVDISERALARARARCAASGNVELMHGAFPADGPAGPFDLITVCEVGYYWSDADLERARDRIVASLAPGGDVLLVHFLPHVDDYVREGDAVHEAFAVDARFERLRHYRAERYRLDLMRCG